MGTTPNNFTTNHPLLRTQVCAETDFTTLATHSEQLADSLLECRNPVLKRALGHRLHTCLSILRATLLDPIPEHLVSTLTVEVIPDTQTVFAPDSEQLCDYALALSQLLNGQAITPAMQCTLTGLQADLVTLFASQLTAPRWVNTPAGKILINN